MDILFTTILFDSRLKTGSIGKELNQLVQILPKTNRHEFRLDANGTSDCQVTIAIAQLLTCSYNGNEGGAARRVCDRLLYFLICMN